VRIATIPAIAAIVAVVAACSSTQTNLPAPTPLIAHARETRFIDSLLSTLTLEEKLGQLTMSPAEGLQTGPRRPAGSVAQIRSGQVGSVIGIWGADRTHALPGPWDPAIYHDPDSDRWFLYWGSSNVYPLYGIELDKRRRLAYEGEPTPLLSLHPDLHGWERFGRDHRDTIIHPYVEGAWMTKHDGRYYLQYGAPGTEYNVYANGTYVGESPLGPFTYAPYNPVSYRPGGFATGAGHGNTFQDAFGNFWNTGTTWIGLNWNFERRIVMYPAGFDRDGVMFADTRFGDFPHRAPTKE
jgi:hypothetical protein